MGHHSDSDGDDDQWERIQKADVRPGMFVSGWEDPNDEVDEDTDPQGNRETLADHRTRTGNT